jgi:RNA polymerase sigma-70 factor (ECF subfamily)
MADTQEIWETCSSALRKFIQSRVSNPEDREDILQDVFLKIHMHRDSLREDERITSWIFRITRNTIIDYYRKHKIPIVDMDNLTDEEDSTVAISDEDLVEEPERVIASGLASMIRELPEKYAQAISMVDFQGISQIELANKLGITPSGARARVQRGRAMIKKMLLECCHFDFDKYGTIIDYRPACCCC